MDNVTIIINLYNNVFQEQKLKFSVSVEDIRKAIKKLKDVYKPNPLWELNSAMEFANYDDGAHRCAYLYKHAMVHTGLVCHLLECAFRANTINKDIDSKRKLNICSLGGGPGNDMIALLMVLQQNFGFIQCNVKIIDYALEWKHVFETVVSELKTGRYGKIKDMVDSRYFSYEYIKFDLLMYFSNEDKNSILRNPRFYAIMLSILMADFITMIKFVSAAACNKTKNMVKCIFKTMKPGAMLLFVDNAVGGFHEMIMEVASENGMENVFGPFKRFEYKDERFCQNQYGYTSQYKTKVTVAIFKKTQTNPYSTSKQLKAEYTTHQQQGSSRPDAVNIGASRHSEPCCSII